MADKIKEAYQSSKNIYDGVLTQGNFFSAPTMFFSCPNDVFFLCYWRSTMDL